MRDSENNTAIAPPRKAAAASAASVTRKVTSSEPSRLGPSVHKLCGDRARPRQDIGRNAADPDDDLPQGEQHYTHRERGGDAPQLHGTARLLGPPAIARARCFDTVAQSAA